jgi:PAS domain S-box-containing protein
MPEGLAFFDSEDRLLLWNLRYADLHPASSPHFAPGLSFVDLLRAGLARGEYPEAVGREDAWLVERLARRRLESCAHEQALASGRWVRIEERALASGGRITVLVDITELKQREASFRLLFEGNPVPIAVFDAQSLDLMSMNAAAEAQYGHPRDEVIGRSVLNFLHPEDRDRAEALLRQDQFDYRAGEAWTHVTAGGAEIKVLPYLQALNHEGRPAIMAALVDVSAAKAAETELKQTRAFLDAVIETMPAMLMVKDAVEHRIVKVNKAGETLLGLSRDDLLGKTDHDLFPKDQADFFVAVDKQVLASPDVHTSVEEAILTRDKGERFLTTKKIAMRGADGRAEHLLVICEDVTEQRAATLALKEARDAAEAANRAKSAFLANMSHEIRTPLNGVIGVADTLARSILDPAQREMVEVVRSSADTLERLLSDVLDLARVESGRIEIQAEPFQIGDAIRDVARLCRPAAVQKSVDLAVEIAPGVDRLGLGDAVRVRQILTNLVSNAVKFTDAGQVRVTAEADTDPGVVILRVADTGVGFDATQKARIFGRFHQADGSITRRFGGTGLGLAISRDLATLMGADLDGESTPGQGSVFTFRVRLPEVAAPAAAGSCAGADAAACDGPVGGLRILLADDHPVNRRVIELMLAGQEVDLTAVENGREAVDAFLAADFDLVLMDMQMPVMDGLTAVRAIRAHEARHGLSATPIIMLTANAMAEHAVESAAAGADLHLGKPIRAEGLYAAIAQTLAARTLSVQDGTDAISWASCQASSAVFA